jgi:hypothetical protein
VKVSLELPKLPKGWKYTGEYRCVREYETYLNTNNNVVPFFGNARSKFKFPIVYWRDPNSTDTCADIGTSSFDYLAKYLRETNETH